jgi:hypothetical protein
MLFEPLESLNKEHLLGLLGLQSRRSPTAYVGPALAVFGAGMLLGITAGLLAAPRTGLELRQDLARRVKNAPAAVATLPRRANEAYHWMTDKVDADALDVQLS